jgi:TonB family protein
VRNPRSIHRSTVRFAFVLLMKTILLIAVLCCAVVPAYAQEPASTDTTRVYGIAEVDSLPRAINPGEMRAALQRAYPVARRVAGLGASVSVTFVIQTDGTLRELQVVASTDTAFDAPTLAAVALLRFTPAMAEGRTVPVRVELPVQWQAPPPPEPELAVTPSDRREDGQRVYTMSELVVETYAMDAVEEPPRPRNMTAVLRAMERLYPAQARMQNRNAIVELRFHVDSTGVPAPAIVTRSSGALFDQPSLELASLMRFHPAKLGGRPVAVWVELPLQWISPARD